MLKTVLRKGHVLGVKRFDKDVGVSFVIEPYVRFRGEPGEQATMFFLDPFGNALEFKAFREMASLFAT